MSLVGMSAGTALTAGAIGAGAGALAAGLSSGGSAKAVQAPAFQPDSTYTSEQAFLQPYSQGLLTGNNIPAYYQSIGQQNSPQFQSALALSNKQIGTSAAEGMAEAGTGRSGLLPQVQAQAVGDNTAALTYQDFLNSNAGKEFLMQQGESTSSSVLQGALTNQGQVNNYAIGATAVDNGATAYNNQQSQAAAAGLGTAIGTIAPLAVAGIAGLNAPPSVFSAGAAPSNTAPVTNSLGAIDNLTPAQLNTYFGLSQ